MHTIHSCVRRASLLHLTGCRKDLPSQCCHTSMHASKAPLYESSCVGWAGGRSTSHTLCYLNSLPRIKGAQLTSNASNTLSILSSLASICAHASSAIVSGCVVCFARLSCDNNGCAVRDQWPAKSPSKDPQQSHCYHEPVLSSSSSSCICSSTGYSSCAIHSVWLATCRLGRTVSVPILGNTAVTGDHNNSNNHNHMRQHQQHHPQHCCGSCNCSLFVINKQRSQHGAGHTSQFFSLQCRLSGWWNKPRQAKYIRKTIASPTSFKQCMVAFQLARVLRQKPAVIAAQLADACMAQPGDVIDHVEVAGAGMKPSHSTASSDTNLSHSNH